MVAAIDWANMASILRRYFGADANGDGKRLFTAWTERCTPERSRQQKRTAGEEWRKVAHDGELCTLPELLEALREKLVLAGHAIDSWPEHERGKKGQAMPHVPIAKSRANIQHALKHMGVTLYQDVFADQFRIIGLRGIDGSAAPRDDGSVEISDAIVTRIWFRLQAHGLQSSYEFVEKALRDIAAENPRHPLREYLTQRREEYAAKWANVRITDRPNLIETLFIKYGGVADTPLHRAWTRKWLLAAVRRAFRPGAKADAMVILESPEGWNKSGVFEAIASTPYFDENLKLAMTPKEVLEQMQGKWIGEVAELVSNNNKEVEAIKQFLRAPMTAQH